MTIRKGVYKTSEYLISNIHIIICVRNYMCVCLCVCVRIYMRVLNWYIDTE